MPDKNYRKGVQGQSMLKFDRTPFYLGLFSLCCLYKAIDLHKIPYKIQILCIVVFSFMT